jgi:hypothetical protein
MSLEQRFKRRLSPCYLKPAGNPGIPRGGKNNRDRRGVELTVSGNFCTDAFGKPGWIFTAKGDEDPPGPSGQHPRTHRCYTSTWRLKVRPAPGQTWQCIKKEIALSPSGSAGIKSYYQPVLPQLAALLTGKIKTITDDPVYRAGVCAAHDSVLRHQINEGAKPSNPLRQKQKRIRQNFKQGDAAPQMPGAPARAELRHEKSRHAPPQLPPSLPTAGKI